MKFQNISKFKKNGLNDIFYENIYLHCFDKLVIYFKRLNLIIFLNPLSLHFWSLNIS